MKFKSLIASATIAAALVVIFRPVSPYLDFTVGYWHPSRLLLQGRNPYEFCDLVCLGQSIDAASLSRMNPGGMYVMYPPVVFPLFFPWAGLPFRAAVPAYLFSFFFLMSLSFQMMGEFFTKDRQINSDAQLLFWFLAIPIGLLVQSVLWGSPTWIGLLGVVMFLVAFVRRPFVAGLFLALTLVKIQLFLIFGAAVLACCVRARNWLTPLGFVLAASISLLSALYFRPDIVTIYSHVAGGGRMFGYVNATVPSVGRYLLNVNGAWYLLAPCLLAGVLAFFWLSQAESSQVTQKLCSVLPFSVGFAPYAWGPDYIAAVPVLVIGAAYIVDNSNSRRGRTALGLCLLALNLFAVLVAFVGTTSPFLQLTYGLGVMVVGVMTFRWRTARSPLQLPREETAFGID